MFSISFLFAQLLITALWVLVRAIVAIKTKRFDYKRELQLLLVYICIQVVVRYTFFPFSKLDGAVQPLLFDPSHELNGRINFIPFVHLTKFLTTSDLLINVIGNIFMFTPLGIIWPIVFKKLDTHKKVITAGIGCSLVIEILQIPFFDRVSDIDDLLFNTAGFLIGYLLYLFFRSRKKDPLV